MIVSKKGQTSTYILEEDRALEDGDPGKTRWKFRAPDVHRVAKVKDSLIGIQHGGESLSSKAGTACLEACRVGLAGWDGLIDEDGNPVRAKFIKVRVAGKKKADGMAVLGPTSLNDIREAVDELGGAIMEAWGLTEGAEELEDGELEEGGERPTDSPTGDDSNAQPQ